MNPLPPEPEPTPKHEHQAEVPQMDVSDVTIVFTSSETNLPKNGEITLTWATTNGALATLNNSSVSLDGSTSVRVGGDTTYTLTVTGLNNNVVSKIVEVSTFDIDYKKQVGFLYPFTPEFNLVRT